MPLLLLLPAFVLLLLCLLSYQGVQSSSSSSSSPKSSYFAQFPYHTVNVSALPGITFTAQQLALEQHYTGYLPTERASLRSSDSRSASSSPPRLFYYLVKARSKSSGHAHIPLVLWFNGGPGCASTVALLQEHGPFVLQRAPPPSKPVEGPSLIPPRGSGEPPLPFELAYNPYSWSNNAHILYIDQPIGVGFSSSAKSARSAVPTTEGDIARALHYALSHFLVHQHPELQDSPVSLSGESYAAKYIPAFASYILGQNRCKARRGRAQEDEVESHEDEEEAGGDRREREDRHMHRYWATFRSLNLTMTCDPWTKLSEPPIKLTSLLIGNGIYSPLLQRFAFRPLALALGLIDVKQANQYAALESLCLGLLRRAVISETDDELLQSAARACSRMHSLILAMSGNVETSDLRRYTSVFNKTLFVEFLNHEAVRSALHVPQSHPKLSSDCSTEVYNALRADTMRGVRGLLPFLLYSLRVTVYTGNFDLKDGTWANEVLLDSLWDWDDRAAWFLARRYVWRPLPSLPTNRLYSAEKEARAQEHSGNEWLSKGGEDVYGYSKSFGNLSFVTVSQAGHMVAASHPEKAADLFYRFIHSLEYYNVDDHETNAQDVRKVCKLLHCDKGGHGVCDEAAALCRCDDNWAGALCSVPVHHATSQVMRSPFFYTHRSGVEPQGKELFYLHVMADDVEAMGVNVTRRSSFSAHQTVDNVMSSCTFQPPLLLRIRLTERAVGGLPKHERNLGLQSDGHLSLSVLWTSKFHNRSPRNATLFLSAFDASNTFFAQGGSTDAQSIAPKLLAHLSTPSVLHTADVWISRCDHHAVTVSSVQGALHDIGYRIDITLAALDAWDRQRGAHSATATPREEESGDAREERGPSITRSLMMYVPWVVCGVLAAALLYLLWTTQRVSIAGRASAAEERRPLL